VWQSRVLSTNKRVPLFVAYRYKYDSALDSESEYQNDNTTGLPRLHLTLIASGIASQLRAEKQTHGF